MDTAPPAAPPPPPDPGAVDERLDTAQAFRRFAARVSRRAGSWLARLDVPWADRDDVLQDALLQMYKRRESHDPAVGSWESWAFAFVSRVVANYHRKRRNRVKRVDVARDGLPEIAAGAPSPEEQTQSVMMHALLEKCLAHLDEDSRAILRVGAEGVEMTDIAAAFGLSLSAAYYRLKTARARLQAALDREQRRNRALDVLVLSVSIDQLLAWNTTTAHVSTETMLRISKTLDRAMSADVAAGKLRDDGTDVERCLGSPNTAPRARLGARIWRAVRPRALSALTHVAAAAIGAVMVYTPARQDPTHGVLSAEERVAASSLVAPPGYSGDPTPAETVAPSTAHNSSAAQEPELRGDVGAAPLRDAGSSAAGRDDIAGEQSLFDLGSTAYQGGYYEAAIKAFREHASQYPRGHFSALRERLFTLSLVRAGRRAEARQRIERVRRASPGSALLAELDAAMDEKIQGR